MQLLIIVGPTGSGKTGAATEYSRLTDAPVVVLDRFQCYPELAVTSGRPSEDAVGSTTRIYLADRRLADGEFCTVDAYTALLDILDQLAGHEPFVIIEGGSLSLYNLLSPTLESLPYGTTVTARNVDVESLEYRAAVRARVASMLGYDGDPALTMLDELREAWRLHEQRGFLHSICGLDAVLSWCDDAGIPVEELSSQSLSPAQRDTVLDRVCAAHYQYAGIQVQTFASQHHSATPPGMAHTIYRLASGLRSDNRLLEAPST
ncbi:MAG: isopentenyl transferase family protein [Mycobacterium sp.]